MRSHAKCPRSEGPLRLFVLMGMEICLLDALYRLQSLPYLRTPGADPSAWHLWLASTPPQVAPLPKSSALGEGAAPPGPDRHTVQRGDNLWTIAANHLADNGITRSNGRIAPYWRELIQDNRRSLRSGNPDLIFPGETVAL